MLRQAGGMAGHDTSGKPPGGAAANRLRASAELQLQVVLEILGGRPQSEISRELGISPQVVSGWKRRAIDALLAEFSPGIRRSLGQGRRQRDAPLIKLVAQEPADNAPTTAEVRRLRSSVAQLESRLERLEKQPQPQPHG